MKKHDGGGRSPKSYDYSEIRHEAKALKSMRRYDH